MTVVCFYARVPHAARRYQSKPMPISDIRNKVLPEIDIQRKKAESGKMRFTALNEQQLHARLLPRSTPSLPIPVLAPMIVWQSWTGTTSPGGSINYSLGVYNPLPNPQSWLFAHAFIGPANFIHNPGMALQSIDSRFPRLTEPAFPGLDVGPGATVSLHFDMKIPQCIEPSNYLGNALLFRGDWHDVGGYVDRGFWPFLVNT
jgi:hypothetical protein